MINKGEILMEEKKYLKWYNKVGYGSGDIAGNVVYAFLTSFIMVYLIWYILSKMNVEEANEKIKKEKGITTQTAQ